MDFLFNLMRLLMQHWCWVHFLRTLWINQLISQKSFDATVAVLNNSCESIKKNKKINQANQLSDFKGFPLQSTVFESCCGLYLRSGVHYILHTSFAIATSSGESVIREKFSSTFQKSFHPGFWRNKNFQLGSKVPKGNDHAFRTNKPRKSFSRKLVNRKVFW